MTNIDVRKREIKYSQTPCSVSTNFHLASLYPSQIGEGVMVFLSKKQILLEGIQHDPISSG
jgi:hypothetical protein